MKDSEEEKLEREGSERMGLIQEIRRFMQEKTKEGI